MHGKYEKRAKEADVDLTEYTLATKEQWTESRDRTQGLIIAARDHLKSSH